MRVLISGATGLIGTELTRQLEAAGHTVLRLVRREPHATTDYRWDPAALRLDPALLDQVDAIVNLSGASLAKLPWTRRYREQILESRVQATRTLTDALRMAASPPTVLLNASAVGIYGDRPGEELTEESEPGTGFVADVVVTWEREAALAPDSTRVVTFRTGFVLARGGVLRSLLPITKLGLAGPLGQGTQHWPWISLHDEVAAIVHLLTSRLSGAVNLVGPAPATANDVMRALSDALHRPFKLRVPEKVLTLALQEASLALLADQLVSSAKLQDDGFEFTHRTPAEAVDWMLRQP